MFVYDQKKCTNFTRAYTIGKNILYLSINFFSIKAGEKFDGNIYGLVTSSIFFISSPKIKNVNIYII